MKQINNLWALCLAALLLVPAAVYGESARTRISSLTDDYSDTADIEAEIVFGRDLAARILGNYKAVSDDDLTRYVNLIGKGLAQYSGRSDLEFCFIVLDTSEINAFATPGGYIFITKGALSRMDNEAQLACVLGHEIAHVTLRHVVRKLNIRGDDDSTFSALSGAIGSSTAAVRTLLEQTLDQAADILFENGYKIREEMEADSVGVKIAALAGYDPFQMQAFLVSSKGFEKPDITYKGEHPQLSVRTASIKKILAVNGMDKKRYAKVRRRFHEHVK